MSPYSTNDRRNRKIYELRINNGLTYEKIGKRFDLSRENIRQIVKRKVERQQYEISLNSKLSKVRTREEILSLPLEIFNLPGFVKIPVIYCHRIETVGNLIGYSEYQLRSLRRVGMKSLRVLREKLRYISMKKGIEIRFKS